MGNILNSKDEKFHCACDSANGDFSDLTNKHSSFEVEMLLVKLNIFIGNQRTHPFISTQFHGRWEYVGPLATLQN